MHHARKRREVLHLYRVPNKQEHPARQAVVKGRCIQLAQSAAAWGEAPRRQAQCIKGARVPRPQERACWICCILWHVSRMPPTFHCLLKIDACDIDAMRFMQQAFVMRIDATAARVPPVLSDAAVAAARTIYLVLRHVSL
eukprot:5024297-Prymnesium_polylepis.5